jgi:hypothetical protein
VNIFIKIIIIFSFTFTLFANENNSTKEIRYLTVSGEVDERLQIRILSWYRSTDDKNPECLRSDWNTGSKKRTLTVRGEIGISGKYKVKIPIDFVDKNKCAYEYVHTQVKLNRKNDEYNYSRYTILSGNKVGSNVTRGYKGGSTGVRGAPNKGITTKNHYFLGNNLKFKCETKKYKTSGNLGFWCIPSSDINWKNGIDELKNMDITIDASVDESKDKFIEFVPEKSFFEKIFN